MRINIINNEKQLLTLEELTESGVMDERDMDFLNHEDIGETLEVTTEGFIRATISEVGDTYHDSYTEMKGWTLGVENKRKYIKETCADTISWLKEVKEKKPDLSLEMGSFKTWCKTSAAFAWRYFFLLHDSTWKNIESDIKSGKTTQLETLYNIKFSDRTDATDHLDGIKNIDGLIKVVELYATRSDKFFESILKAERTIKNAPFHVILLGAADLRRTVKKIVNLAR